MTQKFHHNKEGTTANQGQLLSLPNCEYPGLLPDVGGWRTMNSVRSAIGRPPPLSSRRGDKAKRAPGMGLGVMAPNFLGVKEHKCYTSCQILQEDGSVKKSVYALVLGLLIIFTAGSVYAQERSTQGPAKAPYERPGRPQPGGAVGGMMSHEGTGMMGHEGMRMRGREGPGMMMMRNPHRAGIMMQMRGEMMRISGEAMMKRGDVLRRYGERLEKEGITK